MRLFLSHRRGSPSKSPRCHPQIEMLEDRCLLTAGALDPTFGTGGIAITDLSSQDGESGLTVLPDGKMLVAGHTLGSHGDSDFVLLRYNSDGSLDTSFGTGGSVTTDFSRGDDRPFALVVQPNGDIIEAGASWHQYTNGLGYYDQLALARYHSDGTLDKSFGNRGKVLTDLNVVEGGISDLALQGDGKIVAAGAAIGSTGAYDFLVARYNTDGTLDSSFGTGGVSATDLGASEAGNSLVIQKSGKIVVAGSSYDASTNQNRFELVRYNTDGTLDSDFGSAGSVTTLVGSSSEVNDMLVQPDGYLVVAGDSVGETAVVRYNPDGGLDSSFGAGGVVELPGDGKNSQVWSPEASSVALQADGKLVLGGYGNSSTAIRKFVLGRIKSDGSLDPTFGNAGWVTTEVVSGSGSSSAINHVAIQSDGNIVAAGYVNNGSDVSIALARYLGDPPPPGITVTPTSGLVTTESGGTANFSVVLNAAPTADVIIDLSSSDLTEGTISTPSLTFTSANWSTPQTVTITGVDDTIVDGDIAYTIITAPAVSSDSNYNGLDAADVSATNLDNDSSGSGGGHGHKHLTATSLGSNTGIQTLTADQVQPLLNLKQA